MLLCSNELFLAYIEARPGLIPILVTEDRQRAERHIIRQNENPRPSTCGPGILVVVTVNFLHEHHDPAPQGRIINSHERSDHP